MEGSQGKSVDHGARRIKRDQVALIPVVVVSPTFNVPPLGLDRAPAMELGDRSRLSGDRSRLSDQCDVHSRTVLGQTKRTGRPRRRQEAPTPNVSLSTSSKSFPLLLRKSDQRKTGNRNDSQTASAREYKYVLT